MPEALARCAQWAGWPLAELEREYSPSSRVPSIDACLQEYAERSAQARARLTWRTLRYGDHADETLDLFPSKQPGAPLLVFVHGGYWQQLSRRESAGPALDLVPDGIGYAAIDYTLAPHASLPAIVAQVRRAVDWLCTHARALGHDPQRVVLSGSSAGAHLAAMALADVRPGPTGPAGAPRSPASPGSGGQAVRPAAAVLLSGIYDLRPLVPTYVNEPLGLDDAGAWAGSPLAQDLGAFGPTLCAWGDNETDSFKWQSARFAQALRRAGQDVESIEVAGRNHFDLLGALGDVGSPLGSRVREWLAGGARRSDPVR